MKYFSRHEYKNSWSFDTRWVSSFNAGCIATAFWNSDRGKTDGKSVNGTTVKESYENCVFDLIPPPKNVC